ncbi:MAG: MarR family winged helix-turn-helix transcriptional regulator, partial [Dehalococcoidia bacterium]
TVEEYGLTTEQYAVLTSIGYLGEPARITDIARWLERSTNSISMIVDRMVKASLVKRTRGKDDRRVVYVSFASKGQKAIKPATRAMFDVVRKILLPLPHGDRISLFNLLGTVKYEMLQYLNPGIDVEKMKRDESKQAAKATKWLSSYGLPSIPQAKRQSGKKGRTTRRK